MNLETCLDDPLFSFPKMVGTLSLQEYLEREFARHRNIISHLSKPHIVEDIAPNFPALKIASDNLLITVEKYMQGHLPSAYDHFAKAMEFFKPFLMRDTNGGMDPKYLLERPYYRAREEKPARMLTRKEMFHLPFSKRELAATHRFSIPGLPCLYLSNGIYTCWEELGQPEFEDFQIARFWQTDLDLKILKISTTPERLQIQLAAFPQSAMDKESVYHRLSVSMLMNWPLITACALRSSNPSAPFQREYIIPQLLMQWLMEQSDFDGIQYFSNKAVSQKTGDFSKFINYVFPPKMINTGEYCTRLTKAFRVSETFTYPEMVKLDPNESYLGNVQMNVARENRFIQYQGQRKEYDQTPFGKLELFMLPKPSEHLR